MTKIPAASGDGLRSVDNALLLLRLVAERQVLRVADAAETLGVARSTAHRLLTALRQREFVRQDKPNGPYRPGPALHEIGLAAIGRIDIRRIARPVLEDLSATTQETVSLLLLEGANVRFVDCVESPRSVRVGNRSGVLLPAHCTAGGKAILAMLPQSEVDRHYPDHCLERRTTASLTTWDQLMAELNEARRVGYGHNVEEGENGISALGTAIPDLTGVPLAAIAIAVPASRMPDAAAGHTLVAPLLEARDVIVQMLRTQR